MNEVTRVQGENVATSDAVNRTAAPALARVRPVDRARPQLEGLDPFVGDEVYRALELRLGERDRDPSVERDSGLRHIGAAAGDRPETERCGDERVPLIRECDRHDGLLVRCKPYGCDCLNLLLPRIDGEHAAARGARDVRELRDQEGRGRGELVGFRNDGEKLG